MKLLLKGLLWSLLAAVTLELCARLDDSLTHSAPFLENYDNNFLNAFDQIGNRGRPHAHYLKWNLNSLGFRGPELDPRLPKIMAVGSSETFGQAESEGMEWPRQLERQLKGVQVVNTGFAGETFPTSVRRLPERLALVNPTAVLLYPSVAHYLSIPYIPPYQGPPPAPRPRPRMQDRVESLIKQNAPLWLMTRLRQRQIEQDAPAYGPLIDNIQPELVQRFEQDLRTAARLIREAGAAPIFVTHANRFGRAVTPEERFMLTAWRKFYPNLREDGFLPMEQTMNDVTRRVAAEENILLLDPAPHMPPGPRYFSDFVHFTNEGATAFTQILVKGLARCSFPFPPASACSPAEPPTRPSLAPHTKSTSPSPAPTPNPAPTAPAIPPPA